MTSETASFTCRDTLLAGMRGGQSLDWDVIVVGGGITGAGVLREAVRRGYSALLIEQKDFAWGTSSRSSKMVHGGLRYLPQGEFTLTRHSLAERERLLREAPGLVERMGYYFTVRQGQFPGRFVFSILLWLYDRFAGINNHRFCSRDEVLSQFSELSPEGLKGACYFTDAVTDDARLVLRVLQESVARGGSAINYARVKALHLEDSQVRGVVLEDPESAEAITLRASVVVNATGAWADQLRGQVVKENRIRPLRGSHLVIPRDRLRLAGALTLMHPDDGRSVFVFPWQNVTVVGTTDLDHGEDLNTEASITSQEVDYLLKIINRQFPGKDINRSDVISTWAGVRPVIGSEKSKDPSKERRDHAVWSDDGLVTVSGGKLTTFRLIARDALAAAEAQLPQPSAFDDDSIFSSVEPGTEAGTEQEKRLHARYGKLAATMQAATSAAELKPTAGSEYCLGECRWAARQEAVVHLDDLMLRRTRLGLVLPDGGSQLFDEIRKICQEELNWDDNTWSSELVRYQQIYARHYSSPAADNANA